MAASIERFVVTDAAAGDARSQPVHALRMALVISAPGWRGSAVSLAKIGRGVQRRGHSAVVITGHPQPTERFLERGFTVHQVDLSNTGPRQVLGMRAALRGCDIVLVDGTRDLRLAVLATLGRRVPIVYRYNLGHRAPRSHLADRFFHRRAAATVFQSDYIRRAALAAMPWLARLPLYQIPNGYDVESLVPDAAAGAMFRERYGIPANAPMVLTGSKLSRNKGHGVAADAMSRLTADAVPVVWVVCGNGPARKELEQKVATYGVRALFTGMLDPTQMLAAMNAADVVLHPAPTEIFPNVVGEAMACGRAVVGADAGGLPEVLGRDGTAGVLVPPDDAARMAEAVAGLLADPDRRAAMGVAARERIAREFPLARMEDAYTELFEELVRARR
ncbi:MAG TPA: glycosyltransferase family 4 protein [Gemmatimonadales bacterium]|nr:glycosyltransferase family 4 protein [Gemmatimonadales bacterium]